MSGPVEIYWRYHVPTQPAPLERADRGPTRPRAEPAGPASRVRVARSDACINCGRCTSACVYGVHERRADDVRMMAEPHSIYCRSCFRCVQECPRGALTVLADEGYDSLGIGGWRPDAIALVWQEAEAGRIPVSGAGYRGPFAGPGFDAMWTDMSEIVRPTRDGIHGRETISTAVDIGRKPPYLRFDERGRVVGPRPRVRTVPVPMLLEAMDLAPGRDRLLASAARAARRLGTYLWVGARDLALVPAEDREAVVVRVDSDPEALPIEDLPGPGIVEIGRGPLAPWEVSALVDRLRARRRDLIVVASLAPGPAAPGRAVELARSGIDVILVRFRESRTELCSGRPDLPRDSLRAVHGHLVEEGLRDEVTVLAAGCVGAAEHVPKAILCGADAVLVGMPLWIAQGCRVCTDCPTPRGCPAGFESVPHDWAVQRIINLVGSWRDQLLEVLGAMGLREVRRLRGETGRAIFQKDAEAATFGRMFVPGAGPPAGHAALDRGRSGGPVGPPGPAVFAPPMVVEIGAPYAQVGPWQVVRGPDCISCGVCVQVCPYGVHEYRDGYLRVSDPISSRCIGPSCETNDFYCVANCPKDALSVRPDPAWRNLGDRRWTGDLIAANWEMARTGRPSVSGVEAERGDSGGGFDRLLLRTPATVESLAQRSPPGPAPTEVSTAIELNRRGDGPSIRIPIPIYGGGMSYGSIGIPIMVGRAMAAKAWGTFISTGEGGYPEELVPFADHVITQVATGLFGVREETIQRTRIVEFKYAQGAKPGLGGHLLADKNTDAVARMREAPERTSLFSPFPFHSVYSVEDHKKHVDWVRAINPATLIAVKVSTPSDVDMVAVGSYYAGAHILQIDGGYGGTGAAPDIAKKNIAVPIEYAISRVHEFLEEEGIRDQLTLMVSGGIRTAQDILKAIALGADGVVVGTSELVAVGCVRCGACESHRGCPRGIATTDPELSALIEAQWAAQRIINLYSAWKVEMDAALRAVGLPSITKLRGRYDLLTHLDYPPQEASRGVPATGRLVAGGPEAAGR